MACMFMSDAHTKENFKRYPEQLKQFVVAEIKLGHTWKKGRRLEDLQEGCLDIDDTWGQIRLSDAFPEIMRMDLTG